MINKNTMNNWMSMESSIGLPCEPFDSNRSVFHKIREQSLSDGFKYYFGQSEEPYQPTNPFSSENTINFADIQKRLLQNNEQDRYAEQSSSSSESINFGGKGHERDNSFKRGLKHLASLILKTLIKKRFSSHNQVAEQIERHLFMHGFVKHPMIQDNAREQKNMKRRIYDALNVMISARVIQKEQHSIQPRTQTLAKNYSVIYRSQVETLKLKKVRSRVEAKRELLFQMKSKHDALSVWMQKKRRMRENSREDDKLYFPLVVVNLSSNLGVRLSVGDGALMLGFGEGEVYSETDLIEEMEKEEHLRSQLNSIKNKEQYADELTYI